MIFENQIFAKLFIDSIEYRQNKFFKFNQKTLNKNKIYKNTFFFYDFLFSNRNMMRRNAFWQLNHQRLRQYCHHWQPFKRSTWVLFITFGGFVYVHVFSTFLAISNNNKFSKRCPHLFNTIETLETFIFKFVCSIKVLKNSQSQIKDEIIS